MSALGRAERSCERTLDQGRVVTQRLLHEQSLALTILRQASDFRFDRRARMRGVERLASDLHGSLIEWLVPRDRPPERAFARAFKARHPDDLASMHRKVNVDQMIIGAPPLSRALARPGSWRRAADRSRQGRGRPWRVRAGRSALLRLARSSPFARPSAL